MGRRKKTIRKHVQPAIALNLSFNRTMPLGNSPMVTTSLKTLVVVPELRSCAARPATS